VEVPHIKFNRFGAISVHLIQTGTLNLGSAVVAVWEVVGRYCAYKRQAVRRYCAYKRQAVRIISKSHGSSNDDTIESTSRLSHWTFIRVENKGVDQVVRDKVKNKECARVIDMSRKAHFGHGRSEQDSVLHDEFRQDLGPHTYHIVRT
jgi:hypothetical protein